MTFTDQDVPGLLEVAIGTHAYKVAPLKEAYERSTVPPFRDSFDSAREPGEQSLAIVGYWRRFQTDFRQGVGQQIYDDPQLSDRSQYWRSSGLDPWTAHQIKLLKTTANRRASANTNLNTIGFAAQLYVSDGAELYFTTNPDVVSPTWTAANINVAEGAQTVNWITTDGTKIYAALGGGNGIHTTTLGATTSTHFSALTGVTRLEYANGRLIAAAAGVLYEVKADGSTVTIFTHPQAGWVWNSIAGAPNGIYVCGQSADGFRSEIYVIGLIDTSTALATPIFAAQLPIGEIAKALYYYGGVLCIGTNSGLRLARVGAAGALTYGPLVTIPGGVTAFTAQGEFVWFTWSGFPQNDVLHPADTPVSSGLGRLNLARFTDDLVPAYATDLQTTTSTAATQSATTFSGRRYFTITGVGLFGEHPTNYVTTGYLYSGLVRYGVMEPKVISGVDMRCQPLPAGASIVLAIHDETGTVTTLGTYTTLNGLGPSAPYPANNAVGENVDMHVTLNLGTDPTQNVVVRRWTIRGFPIPERSDRIVVPLELRDKEAGGWDEGAELGFDTFAEFQYLKGLEAAGTVTTYKEFGSTYNVRIEQVTIKPDKANRDHTFWSGVCLVTMITTNKANP